MKILITGASGLLGKYLMKVCQVSCYGTWFTNSMNKSNYYRMDVSDKDQILYIFDRLKPDVVIHCAAIGNVDFTENNYQSVRQVNYDGTANLIDVANDYKTRLVYISTNAVYDGNNPPYNEKSDQSPINAYGRIKKSTEQLVKSLCRYYIIVRPFMLYGWNRKNGRSNWLSTIYNRLKVDQEIRLVNDVYWQPTSAKDAAKGILQLCNDWQNEQSYNLACEQKITLYEFGLLIAQAMNKNTDLIQPVLSSEFKSIAPRPKDTSFDVTKIKEFGLVIKNPIEGIKDFIK